MEIEADVLIVGGGPVGLALGLILGRAGLRTLIFEARSAPTPAYETRALTWMPRGVEMLDALGLRERFERGATSRTTHEFWSRRRCLVRMAIDKVDSPFPRTLDLSQHDTEVLLEAAVRETGNVELRRAHRIELIDTRYLSAVATVLHEGTPYQARAALGVACDGFHSPMRDHLVIAAPTRDYGADTGVADVELNTPVFVGSSRIVLDPHRPHGFFPFGARSLRLVYRINEGESRREMVQEDRVRALTKELLPAAAISRFLWASAFRLAQKQSVRYREGRWLLAGDAAHAMGPSAGAGLQLGVLGAFRLAWRLVYAARDPHLADRLFADYEREQSAAAEQTQRDNALIFRNMALRNPLLGALRSRLLRIIGGIPSVVQKMANGTTLEATVLPVGSAIDVPGGGLLRLHRRIAHFRVGMRAPAQVLRSLPRCDGPSAFRHVLLPIGPDGSPQQALIEHARSHLPVAAVTGAWSGAPCCEHPAVAVVRPDQELSALVSD